MGRLTKTRLVAAMRREGREPGLRVEVADECDGRIGADEQRETLGPDDAAGSEVTTLDASVRVHPAEMEMCERFEPVPRPAQAVGRSVVRGDPAE